jgi:hypothetical protein
MTTAVTTNWLTVIGLIYCIYGLILLGDALLAGRLAVAGDVARSVAANGYRQIAIPLAMVVLALGFLAQMAAQFVVIPVSTPLGLALLGLAFVVLFHVLISDSLSDRQHPGTADAAPAQEPAAWHSRETTSAPATVKLRAAS